VSNPKRRYSPVLLVVALAVPGAAAYRAIHLAWDFQHTDGAADTAKKAELLGKAVDYLTGALPVELQLFSVE